MRNHKLRSSTSSTLRASSDTTALGNIGSWPTFLLPACGLYRETHAGPAEEKAPRSAPAPACHFCSEHLPHSLGGRDMDEGKRIFTFVKNSSISTSYNFKSFCEGMAHRDSSRKLLSLDILSYRITESCRFEKTFKMIEPNHVVPPLVSA